MAAGQVGMMGGPAPGGAPLELPMEELAGFAGWWKRSKWRAITVIELIVVLVVWDVLIARMEVVSPLFFPAPTNIWVEMQKLVQSGELWPHLMFSLRNLSVGYLLGAGLGIFLGLIIGASGILERLWGPIVWSAYSTPIITIRPLLIIWFGFGWTALAFLVFLSAIFPVLINTMAGVHEVETSLLRAGRVFGASRLQLYTKIILPSTVPYILTGLRLAVGSALIGMLVGELVSSNLGLGYIVAMGSYNFNMSKAFCGIIILVALSLVLVNSIRWLEDRVVPWRRESQ
jgi:ABC-type nitrate/sulfonate/bicarbonate transport system permease component